MAEGKVWRLLLVDDDPGLRMMLGDFLLMNGYEVETASSGEVALVQMEKSRPDLIILDMGMPGMGGMGFLERITDRSGRTKVPVLVLTARSAMAEFFADKQIAGFITKPCDPEDLLREVQQILFMSSNLPSFGEEEEAEPAAPLPNYKTVVVAEDNVILNEALRQGLIDRGFSVESVRTGPEALEMAVARRPDGLVLPIEARGMGADEVLSVLRRLPGTKGIQAIVYGIGTGVNVVDRIARLDTANTTLIESTQAAEILPVVAKIIV